MRATERADRVDRDLVEQAQRGDREAFAILARTRGDRLFGIARRIVRDVGLAEDAVQQALVIAWRELPRLRDPERFDAWLQRMLVHACYAEARSKRAWISSIRVLPIDGPAAPDDLASFADRDEVERGFRRLPPEQRAILVLHHYLGLEFERDRRGARHPRRHRSLEAPLRPPGDARGARGRRTARSRGRGPIVMTGHIDAERMLDAFLAPEHDQLPDRVVDAALTEIARTPQRRALRVPWRFPLMPQLLRYAVVAVVAVAIGAGRASCSRVPARRATCGCAGADVDRRRPRPRPPRHRPRPHRVSRCPGRPDRRHRVVEGNRRRRGHRRQVRGWHRHRTGHPDAGPRRRTRLVARQHADRLGRRRWHQDCQRRWHRRSPGYRSRESRRQPGVVAGRHAHRVRQSSRRRLRALCAGRRWRRTEPGDEQRRRRRPPVVVAGHEPDRVRFGSRRGPDIWTMDPTAGPGSADRRRGRRRDPAWSLVRRTLPRSRARPWRTGRADVRWQDRGPPATSCRWTGCRRLPNTSRHGHRRRDRARRLSRQRPLWGGVQLVESILTTMDVWSPEPGQVPSGG